MSPDTRTASLPLSAGEMLFLKRVAETVHHFILDEEQIARISLREKFLASVPDSVTRGTDLRVTREELLFLTKIARESFSFITGKEKTARRALASKLCTILETAFGEAKGERGRGTR